MIVFLSLSLCLDARPLKILSLDGGGVRGVVSLQLLKNLERETGLKCHEDFDIYAGTSTGSIIAVCLACGLSVDTIMKDYKELASEIFSDPNFFDFFEAKYETDRLKRDIHKVFQRSGIPLDTLVNQVKKKLVIPTVALDDPMSKRWRLQVINNIKPGEGNISLVDAILESTAAPTYFPSYKDHVDGGMAMNDPALAALVTAYRPAYEGFSRFVVLSVGTGYTNRYVESDESWGLIDWVWSGSKSAGGVPLVNLLLDVQQQVPGQFCKQLLGHNYLKLNFVLPEDIPLDAYLEISDLIEDTDEYIFGDQETWNEHVRWARRHLQ